MSEYSRIKKFAKLRDSLQQENDSVVLSEALEPFAKRLHKVDQQYAPTQTTREAHSPLHARNLAYSDLSAEKDEEVLSTFNNDDLDSFIEEVKRYNLKKGYRKASDTQSNILKEFVKETPKVEAKTESISHDAMEDITQQIKLYADEEFTSSEDECEDPSIKFEPSIDWIEKTQQLSVALEEYENELSEMNETVINTNRLLNFVIALLVLALLSFMGVILWVLLGRGLM